MEITKDNITQTISALRQCAKEHKRDNTPTCGIIVSELCTDVADYLEKIKNVDMVQIPNEEEMTSLDIKDIVLSNYLEDSGTDLDIIMHGRHAYWCGWCKAIEWLKSKIVK